MMEGCGGGGKIGKGRPTWVDEVVQVTMKVAASECQPCRWGEVGGFWSFLPVDDQGLVPG